MMACASTARSSEGSQGTSDTRMGLRMLSSAYFHRHAASKDRVPFHQDDGELLLTLDCLAMPATNQHCCVVLVQG
jgi:hypothetical protein